MIAFPRPQARVLPHKIALAWPPTQSQNDVVLNRIMGSLVGLAVGDALGASVEFRPHEYLVAHPIREMMAGGTWGLRAGQWTDDTSMALCLASSLITQEGFDPYNQMVRYKWWYQFGYLSSTGQCFDIGNATRNSLEEFYRRQKQLKRECGLQNDSDVDQVKLEFIKKIHFDVNCSHEGVAGNGALMRLAPVPLFFHRRPSHAVELSGQSARLTHGDKVAVDACRYYGALIVAAVNGEEKASLLSHQFYNEHQQWFGTEPLHQDIIDVAQGSFKKGRGYEDGIRGKGQIVWALEAALWAFWSANSFEDGALNAVNLGDDTDTTAAIYGQLAGAYYRFQGIPKRWFEQLYAHDLIACVAEWLQYFSPPLVPAPQQQRVSRERSQFSTPFQQSYHAEIPPPREQRIINPEKSKQRSHKRRPLSAPRSKNTIASYLNCMGNRRYTDV